MNFQQYQEEAHSTAIYPDMITLVLNRLLDAGLIERLDWSTIDLNNHKKLCSISNNPYYPALGLGGEVGEYQNKLKKVQRDHGGEITEEFKEFAKGELGDILWYLSECASSLDLSLEEIAKANIEKLASRKERGKLQGEGDNR